MTLTPADHKISEYDSHNEVFFFSLLTLIYLSQVKLSEAQK